MADCQIRAGPDWMSLLPQKLIEVPLWNLSLPGSHDSMSFSLDRRGPLVPSQPALLKALDLLLPCCTRTCVDRWATTQEQTLWDQLDLGIRFLDLRVARKTNDADRKLVFHHGLYTLTSVKEGLYSLRSWLQAHPSEVLILCFSHFESMTDEDHSYLVTFILHLFNSKLCSPEDSPSLFSCWSRSQQLIVSYDDQKVAQQHPELWPGIPYWYAERSNPEDVIHYLEEKKKTGRPGGFFVCGLNLTEDTCYILRHPLQDMRSMTLAALGPLLGWAALQRPGPQVGGVNIVCCDFIDVRDFCSIIIGLNDTHTHCD